MTVSSLLLQKRLSEQDLLEICGDGGLCLNKWVSNHQKMLDSIAKFELPKERKTLDVEIRCLWRDPSWSLTRLSLKSLSKTIRLPEKKSFVIFPGIPLLEIISVSEAFATALLSACLWGKHPPTWNTCPLSPGNNSILQTERVPQNTS